MCPSSRLLGDHLERMVPEDVIMVVKILSKGRCSEKIRPREAMCLDSLSNFCALKEAL